MITKCANCNKKFNTFPYKIKRHKNLFCSERCQHAFANTKVSLKCKQCGVIYTVKKYRKDISDYCSKSCHNKSMESRRITYCAICKKEIIYKTSRIKYGIPKTCSKKCSGLFRAHKIERACQTCGKIFYANASEVKNGKKKFCSRECIRYEARKNKLVETECAMCQKKIKRWPYKIKRHNHLFCSEECQHKFKKTITGEKNHNYKNGYNRFIQYSFYHRNDKCQICNSDKKIQVHHIDGNRNNNSCTNWIPICPSCHGRIHTLANKLNLDPVKALSLFIGSRLFNITKLEFREFWAKNLLR